MWIEAIVMPREQPRPPARRGGRRSLESSVVLDRRVAHARASEESRLFREQVLEFLREHQLMTGVRWISEPGQFPLVTLHCTRAVLEQLRHEPAFDAGLSMPLELLG
ncbi:hypothetical protein LZ198_26170 [Myxococcus sp. K15C18031901]|uniref:hypothetical protein n=1 Tax=Myxococcus dinghuensis TaxID=2906761 RepID=UPI0020A7120D|nr:hypothetical protein [Myxococcus dinghuensis]MCP3102363.1 hypothetical protein [Myxococcus dinghuensis]